MNEVDALFHARTLVRTGSKLAPTGLRHEPGGLRAGAPPQGERGLRHAGAVPDGPAEHPGGAHRLGPAGGGGREHPGGHGRGGQLRPGRRPRRPRAERHPGGPHQRPADPQPADHPGGGAGGPDRLASHGVLQDHRRTDAPMRREGLRGQSHEHPEAPRDSPRQAHRPRRERGSRWTCAPPNGRPWRPPGRGSRGPARPRPPRRGRRPRRRRRRPPRAAEQPPLKDTEAKPAP